MKTGRHTDNRLIVGKTLRGKNAYFTEETRQTHIHVIGSSGKGKSKFLEGMIREDILNARGMCLIDPHGYLYNDLVTWCESKHLLDEEPWKDKIVLFDPSSDEWTFGFNPLDFGASETAFGVDSMVKACSQVWGGEDTAQTPLLKRCLRATFHALVENHLTLLEAIDLTSPLDRRNIRKYMTDNITDTVFRDQWEMFNDLRPREFMEHFSSTNNRLLEFLAAPRIRNIIGQTENIINFKKFMDEGYIVLINLASSDKLSDDNARLLGTLMVNDLFLKARQRDKQTAKKHPFYLYIDECALFINEDIRRILDEGRKFGLHLALAHQHLSQLRRAGEDVYGAVMGSAQTKVVFGGLTPEDAHILAEQMFIGEFDLEEDKKRYRHKAIDGHIRTWMRGEATAQSHAHTTTTGTVHTDHTGWSATDTDGMSDAYAEGESIEGSVHTAGTQASQARTGSGGYADSVQESESDMEGGADVVEQTEAFEAVYKDQPGTAYTLEEHIYRSMALMINQPRQRALVKIPDRHSMIVNLKDVPDEEGIPDSRLERFRTEAYQLSDFANKAEEITVQIRERQEALRLEAIKSQNQPEDTDDDME